VSLALHHWIDVSFGYKLSGAAAVAAMNVHHSAAASAPRRIHTTGLSQLFHAPHPRRLPRRTRSQPAPASHDAQAPAQQPVAHAAATDVLVPGMLGQQATEDRLDVRMPTAQLVAGLRELELTGSLPAALLEEPPAPLGAHSPDSSTSVHALHRMHCERRSSGASSSSSYDASSAWRPASAREAAIDMAGIARLAVQLYSGQLLLDGWPAQGAGSDWERTALPRSVRAFVDTCRGTSAATVRRHISGMGAPAADEQQLLPTAAQLQRSDFFTPDVWAAHRCIAAVRGAPDGTRAWPMLAALACQLQSDAAAASDLAQGSAAADLVIQIVCRVLVAVCGALADAALWRGQCEGSWMCVWLA